MPAGATALYAAAAIYCILLFVQVRMVASAGSALYQTLLAAVLLAIYARQLLRWRGYPNRVQQTVTALFTAAAAITFLMLAPTYAMAPFFLALANAQSAAELPQPSAVAMLAYIIIGLWGVIVAAHIYRHALQGSFWRGLAAALGYEALLLFVFAILGQL